MKCRIHWKSLLTDETGQGEPMDCDTAHSFVDHLNKEWEGVLFHWIEEVK